MIINKELLNIVDPKNVYLREETLNAINNSDNKYKVFRNDYYKVFQDIKKIFLHLKGFKWARLFKYNERTPEELNEYFKNLRRNNSLNLIRLEQLKKYMQFLGDNVEDTSIFMSKIYNTLNPLIVTVENTILNSTINSIKNENFAMINYNQQNVFSYNTCNIAASEGCLTNPIYKLDKINMLPISNSNIAFNIPQLVLNDNINNIDTNKLYIPGYYFGNFISNAPVFENVNKIQNINSDSEDHFYLESYDSRPLEMSLEYTCFHTKESIGTITIDFGKCSSVPIIKNILVKYNNANSYSDITDIIFSKEFRYKNVTINDKNNKANIKLNDNPTIDLILNLKNVEKIKIIISIPDSEEIEYKEYQVITEENSILKNFNILESLYIDNYTFGKDVDVNKIDKKNIENYIKLGKLVPVKKTVDKKYLSIKNIICNYLQIEQSGVFISKDIGRDTNISSVELYVNDNIPEGLDLDCINYSISTDDINWLEIYPSNKPNIKSKKLRITMDEKDPNRDNIKISNKIKLKILIDNLGSDQVPKLYSAMLRIKEVIV